MKVFIIIAVCLIIAGCDNAIAVKSYSEGKITDTDIVAVVDNDFVVFEDGFQSDQDIETNDDTEVADNRPDTNNENEVSDDVEKGWTKWAGLKWSDLYIKKMTIPQAQSYCQSIGGRVPTISEGRTLIKNCPATETGGTCPLTDTCSDDKNPQCYPAPEVQWAYPCIDTTGMAVSPYSCLGDPPHSLWLYVPGDKNAWAVGFATASLTQCGLASGSSVTTYVRCVKAL